MPIVTLLGDNISVYIDSLWDITLLEGLWSKLHFKIKLILIKDSFI